MNIKKKIGIWGFGRVGKSIVHLLSTENCNLSVMTKDALCEDDMLVVQQYSIATYTEQEKETFLAENDYIIPSPGIDIRDYYHTYAHKWLTELDLFYDRFKKPIITITGAVGKTTTTYLLDQILRQYNINICMGGNIGIPMCDVIAQQNNAHYALLEVSSFQLEYVNHCAPHLAIWTNLVPNHLDRHATYDDYFNAKYNSIAHQNSSDKALVPLGLAQKIKQKSPKSIVYYFNPTLPTQEELKILHQDDMLFFIDGNHIKKKIGGSVSCLIALEVLPDITFTENWLVICSALDILGLNPQDVVTYTHTLAIPEHRMEKMLSNTIVFYNDSKSTTTASTQAAIEKLNGKSIILFIGGLSKGVDRADFIKGLKDKVKHVYCFGAEADTLNAYCVAHGISAHAFSTLDSAFEACVKQATTKDCILFSPAGSSYDLFKDYEDRGNYFKKLVHDYNTDTDINK